MGRRDRRGLRRAGPTRPPLHRHSPRPARHVAGAQGPLSDVRDESKALSLAGGEEVHRWDPGPWETGVPGLARVEADTTPAEVFHWNSQTPGKGSSLR